MEYGAIHLYPAARDDPERRQEAEQLAREVAQQRCNATASAVDDTGTIHLTGATAFAFWEALSQAERDVGPFRSPR